MSITQTQVKSSSPTANLSEDRPQSPSPFLPRSQWHSRKRLHLPPMAAVLDSLAAPFAAARPSPPQLRSLTALHGAEGLRVGRGFQKWALSSSATGSRSERLNLARRRLVCESKKAAVEDVASVNDSTWQSLVLNSDTPALVEFWAPWCGPCRMIEPVVIELAQQYAGKLKCLKVNTDESPSIATQYGIKSIPTLIIFKNGEKKDAIIGAVPKTTLISSIEKFL